jgi:hypothetical protein
MVPWYRDQVLWGVLGFGLVVFVLPAVSVLVVRDILRRYRRERREKSRRVPGFQVIPPTVPTPEPVDPAASRGR